MVYSEKRLKREQKTIEAMIAIYCRGEHDVRKGLCANCQELLDYALLRLEKCPYQEEKPICARCPIHCYKPEKREEVRRVMRFAGPRMLVYHPWLAIAHLLDGKTKAPEKPGAKKNESLK